MLYSYRYQPHPLRRLHASVCAFIRKLHSGALDPANFDIEICCTGELLARARRGASLRDRLRGFYDAWFALGVVERGEVYFAFRTVNRIEKQLQNAAPRITLEDLPGAIQASAHSLFVHLYEASMLRAQVKEHWEEFYETLPFKVCPFCGIEDLHHPLLFKQDYDHVLCKSAYPFAAVNLRNLIPCGRDCNTIFKQDKDIIFAAAQRRKAFYPFRDYGIEVVISLTGSRLPASGSDRGEWQIHFEPDIEEIRTWTDVFELERRYELDVFAEYYTGWMGEFIDWLSFHPLPVGGWTATEVQDGMREYQTSLQTDQIRDRRFLKHALFTFILVDGEETIFPAIANQLNFRNN